MEGHITVLEGPDLRHLLDYLGVPEDRRPYKVRIYQAPDASEVKVKTNEHVWTPGLGTKDGAA